MTKRTLTLLEIMIVIFLITIITGAIGYNMKGALEKGKIFRSERAREQLREIILLRMAEGHELADILKHLPDHVKESGLAKDPKAILSDGWGVAFEFKPSRSRDDVEVISQKLKALEAKKKANSQGSGADENDD